MPLFQEIPGSFGSQFKAQVDATQWVSATLLLATACQGTVRGEDYDVQISANDGGFSMTFTAYDEAMGKAFSRLNARSVPSETQALCHGPGVFEQLERQAPMQPVLARSKSHLRQLIAVAIEQQGHQCDLNHIDVSSIDDFSELFKNSLFNGNISRWNVSNANDMSNMFASSLFNGDISQWNTERVTDMRAMFYKSQFNSDVSQWNVGRVRCATVMFANSPFAGDVSNWDVRAMREMPNMFDNSSFRGDLSKWRFDSMTRCSNLMRSEDAMVCPQPSIYHWLLALQAPYELKSRSEWADHFQAVLPMTKGLGLPALETATAIQDAWLLASPRLGRAQELLVALPSLE